MRSRGGRSPCSARCGRRSVVEVVGGAIRLVVDLPQNFALNQPLSPFALAAIDLLDPDDAAGGAGTGHYALDVVSVIESTLDDPRQILSQQQYRARGEAVAEMKRDGLEYEERMEALEEITHPKPLEELLAQAYAGVRVEPAVGARLRAAAEVGRARHVRASDELRGVRAVVPARPQ